MMLQGKAVVVTGAGRGLGRAYAISDRSRHVTGQVFRFDGDGLRVLRPSEFLVSVEPPSRTPEAVAQTFSAYVDEVLQPVGQAQWRPER